MPTNNSINTPKPIDVSSGGTGQSTLTTANGILAAGTTATGAIQNIGTGSAGQVLTSNGTGLPSFQAAPGGGITGPGSSTDRAIATWNGTGGTALFNNSAVTIDSSGRQTNTAQPAFFAYLSGNQNNATGDGTTYTIPFDSELYDQNSNFAANTFTAPIAGIYQFNFQISLANLSAGHNDAIITIGGINATRFSPIAINTGGTIVTLGGAVCRSLAAGATVTMAITVSGSTKTVTVVSSTSNTVLSGFKAC